MYATRYKPVLLAVGQEHNLSDFFWAKKERGTDAKVRLAPEVLDSVIVSSHEPAGMETRD